MFVFFLFEKCVSSINGLCPVGLFDKSGGIIGSFGVNRDSGEHDSGEDISGEELSGDRSSGE